MDIIDNFSNIEQESKKHQLAKMILGATAAFIAKELVEKVYDSILENRKNKSFSEKSK